MSMLRSEIRVEGKVASAASATIEMTSPRGPAPATGAPSAFSSCCPANGESSSLDDSIELNDSQEGANNNTMYHNSLLEAQDYRFPKRPPVDIVFRDIRYNVKRFNISKAKFESKDILHGLNGSFKSGELTAIMGPSGAGKSTLLNIMAGYVSSGVSGMVQVNGKNRSHNSESFRKLSCYIQQHDALRPWLTVNEAMTCATHLKLGFGIPMAEKRKLIEKILFMLGLEQKGNTPTVGLSGGQKKRLAIALEMINNPPILFLDEPTTGLDSSSCTQCISLLKRLAEDGRTIVCTIHTPSALLFEMFDQLYTVVQGHCFYQGPTKEMLPFLGDLGYHCPSYHNPADFMMEIAVGEYGADVGKVIKAALKKYYEISSRCIELDSAFDDNEKPSPQSYGIGAKAEEMCKLRKEAEASDTSSYEENGIFTKTKPASLVMQFLLLVYRNLLMTRRNYFLLFCRILAHATIATIFGYLYIGVGPNANQVLANYVYLYGSMLVMVYTGKMAVVLSFQIEMESLMREHFNRWYKLGPYFLSVLVLEIPVQIFCSLIYVVISYHLTGNYVNFERFCLFAMFCITGSICAQAWGFFVGATLSVKLAVFIGPIVAVLFSVFGFCTRYADITPLFKWMWHISYYRASFHGLLNSVYGMNREDLHCPEQQIYCHFKNPVLFQKDMDIEHVDMQSNFVLIVLIIITMYISTLLVLWYKLNKRPASECTMAETESYELSSAPPEDPIGEDQPLQVPQQQQQEQQSPSAEITDSNLVSRRQAGPKLQPLHIPAEPTPESASWNATSGLATANANGGGSTASSLVAARLFKPVTVGFKNLSYSVRNGIFRKGRDILKDISGEFRAGELTAIMGPSGAGKSTLLDILAGFTEDGYTGEILVNKQVRDLKRFRRMSAYIMQDHDLQPHLTVLEAMHFSANLKIGAELSPASKKVRMNEILRAIGLYDAKKTRTGKLSGGQKKRLAIALEIVNNPPVMFFDEPTSGLDSSTSTQCVALLKQLAREGRTIVCTIHQPSALLFNMFDHLYAVAEGECIYTGGTGNIVSFLKELDIVCPEHYNPTDYLLEIATNDYGRLNDSLVEKMMNGQSNFYRNPEQPFSPTYESKLLPIKESPGTADGPMVVLDVPIFPDDNERRPVSPVLAKPKKLAKKLSFNPEKWCGRDEVYTTSFCRQFTLLLIRTFLILSRDRSLMTMRFAIHCLIAPLIGLLYLGIGNQATHVFNNYNYVFFSIMFLMFTAFSSMTMAFPLELPIITREHFNRWYSLRAYYIAMTVADIPIQLLCTVTYIVITYFMTAQPPEAFRIGLFTVICLMVAWVAQGLGLLVASLFDVKNGAIFGPFFICPFLIFSGFFIHLTDAHPVMQWLFHISFLKYALQGAALAIFGYDRPRMECEETYCHFVLPKKFLKEVDMLQADFVQAVIALTVIFFVFRVAAFYVMRFRMKNKI
ncbi:ABC transporter G family member 6 [Anopheles darlingi]|nr:ABC transporter G family member 6 [Anopheles darlingi]